MEQIKNRMEELRAELNKLTGEIDSCDRGRLLEVSRELDEVICEYIKSMEK